MLGMLGMSHKQQSMRDAFWPAELGMCLSQHVAHHVTILRHSNLAPYRMGIVNLRPLSSVMAWIQVKASVSKPPRWDP